MIAETRCVWAVDVLTSGVSLAAVIEPASGGVSERPLIGRVEAPAPTHDHSPRTTWERGVAVADQVVEKLMSRGMPTLVIFAKQQWGSSTAVKIKNAAGRSRTTPVDHSAQRRIMLQALIEDRLHQRGVPVGEFPYPTALTWMNDGEPSKRGGHVMAELARRVTETWGITQPVVEARKTRIVNGVKEFDEVEVRVAFRIQVAALAAIAAMIVGVETGVPVTEERLRIASGEGNQAVQLPASRRCPTDLNLWDELRRRPTILKAGV